MSSDDLLRSVKISHGDVEEIRMEQRENVCGWDADAFDAADWVFIFYGLIFFGNLTSSEEMM